MDGTETTSTARFSTTPRPTVNVSVQNQRVQPSVVYGGTPVTPDIYPPAADGIFKAWEQRPVGAGFRRAPILFDQGIRVLDQGA